MSLGACLGLAGVAGLLGIERRAFLQAMLSRPLVAAPLLGLVLGWPIAMELVILGAGLELFFLVGVDLGAAHADHELIATCGCAASAATLIHSGAPPTASFAVATLLFLPLGKIGILCETASDRFNACCLPRLSDSRPVRSQLMANLFGIWIPFLGAAVAALAASFVSARWLVPLSARLSHRWIVSLDFVWGLFLVIAAAAALRALPRPHALPFLVAAILLSVSMIALREGWL